MQITHCYYPQDLLNKYLYNTPCLIIGLQLNPRAEDYIIVTLLPFQPDKLGLLLQTGVLRRYNNGKITFVLNFNDDIDSGAHRKVDKDTLRQHKKTKKHLHQQKLKQKVVKVNQEYPANQLEDPNILHYYVLGFLNYQSDAVKFANLPLNLIYNNLTKYPISTNIQLNMKIILFDVPDPRVMQFYSIKPIRLELLDTNQDNLDNALRRDGTETFIDKMKYHGNGGLLNYQERSFDKIIKALNDCFFYRLYFYTEVLKNDRKLLVGLKVIKPWEQNFSITRNLQNLRIFLVNNLYIVPSYIYQGEPSQKKKSVMARKRAKSIDYNRQELLKNYYEEKRAMNKSSSLIIQTINYCFRVLIVYFVISLRILILGVSKMLNFRLGNHKNLVEISLAAQQIDLRFQQLSLIPSQFIKIKQMQKFSDFISLYNIIWLIMNDTLFGFTVGQYVHEHSNALQKFLIQTILDKYLYKEYYKMILWLMSFPAGFKLNSKLAVFFGELFLWIIEFFFTKIILSVFFIEYIIPIFISLISYSGGIFGATFVISLTCDFLKFISLHIYCFYFASAKIFNWLLVILKSLFNLFYGKKNNVLKKRTDSADYSLDQLLLGTLLFTITLFIIPTVSAFYLAFLIARLFVLCTIIILEIALSCFNHFPIFAVLLRFKDSFRVPGGINFKLLNFINEEQANLKHQQNVSPEIKFNSDSEDFDDSDDGDFSDGFESELEPIDYDYEEEKTTTSKQHYNGSFNDNGNIIYLELRNAPLSFANIFYPYIVLWNKLKLFYFSPSMLKNLLTGVPISVSHDKLYLLLYLVLPTKPIDTKLLIEELKRTYL